MILMCCPRCGNRGLSVTGKLEHIHVECPRCKITAEIFNQEVVILEGKLYRGSRAFFAGAKKDHSLIPTSILVAFEDDKYHSPIKEFTNNQPIMIKPGSRIPEWIKSDSTPENGTAVTYQGPDDVYGINVGHVKATPARAIEALNAKATGDGFEHTVKIDGEEYPIDKETFTQLFKAMQAGIITTEDAMKNLAASMGRLDNSITGATYSRTGVTYLTCG